MKKSNQSQKGSAPFTGWGCVGGHSCNSCQFSSKKNNKCELSKSKKK